MTFAQKYGPWAVVAGASVGIGREFARQIAAAGVPSVLVSRRQQPLDELAAQIKDETGVECVVAAIDLAAPDAHEHLVAAVADREVGLYIGVAGADPNGSHFLDIDVQPWIDLVQRNIVDTVRACHQFAGPMRRRGHGGLLLVGSGACWGGGSFLATYAGSKAFELNFAEGLWGELHPYGVDVLYMALTMTDTPAFRALLAEKGRPVPEGIADPAEVARIGLERLAHGPLYNWGQADDEAGMAPTSAAARRQRVQVLDANAAFVFGERDPKQPVSRRTDHRPDGGTPGRVSPSS